MIKLIPYIGTEDIQMYSSLFIVEKWLHDNNISYEKRIRDNSHCTVKYNWIILVIEESIYLFFSEGNYKLFKIYTEKESGAIMENGITFDTFIEDAITIDPTLEYDDWGEVYESSNGYWIEEDLDTGKIFSMTIFIKEINDEDFEYCKW